MATISGNTSSLDQKTIDEERPRAARFAEQELRKGGRLRLCYASETARVLPKGGSAQKVSFQKLKPYAEDLAAHFPKHVSLEGEEAPKADAHAKETLTTDEIIERWPGIVEVYSGRTSAFSAISQRVRDGKLNGWSRGKGERLHVEIDQDFRRWMRSRGIVEEPIIEEEAAREGAAAEKTEEETNAEASPPDDVETMTTAEVLECWPGLGDHYAAPKSTIAGYVGGGKLNGASHGRGTPMEVYIDETFHAWIESLAMPHGGKNLPVEKEAEASADVAEAPESPEESSPEEPAAEEATQETEKIERGSSEADLAESAGEGLSASVPAGQRQRLPMQRLDELEATLHELRSAHLGYVSSLHTDGRENVEAARAEAQKAADAAEEQLTTLLERVAAARRSTQSVPQAFGLGSNRVPGRPTQIAGDA